MPAVVPIIAAAAIAVAFPEAIVAFVLVEAVNMLSSRLFAPKPPKANFTQAAQDRSVMVRSSVETHKVVYGEARVSGPIVFAATTDGGPTPYGGPMTGTNLMMHLVVALAGHEVAEIGTVYFNDKPLTIDANGYVNCVPYSYYPANPTPNSKPIATAARTDEVVTVTTASAHGFAAGDQVTVTTATDLSMNGDFIILAAPTSTTFTYANGGPNASATGGTAVDNTIPTSVNSYARVRKHTGAVGQAADPDLVAEVPGWDANHRLDGIAYLYVRLQYNPDVFGQGIPNISAIVRGKKVHDPRDGTDGYSTNAALCVRDYLVSDYGFGCDADEVNDTYFAAAANHCDETVALTTGGSQKRYTVNGVIDTATAPVDNLNALVATLAGAVTYVQGKFRAHAGVYDAPAGDITRDMLAGPPKFRTRTTRQQLFNAVKGTFVDPARNWQPTDFPFVTNPTYEAQDGGEQIFKDIQLPLTNHPEAAQRIAKLILEQGRQGITLELTLNHAAVPYAVFDTVTYTDPDLGWDHKVFRVRKLATAGLGPVVLSLQEESSGSYDWASGEATVLDAAPDTNLPDPFRVTPPTGVAFNSRAVETTGGDTVYNLVLTWNPHPDAFVAHGGRFEIQYKLSAEADWRPSFFVGGDLAFADVLSSSPNVSYDLRIRAVSSLGANVRSAWTYLLDCVIGSSGGVGTTLDWGSVTDAVGTTNDWGAETDAVGTTNDWGSVT